MPSRAAALEYYRRTSRSRQGARLSQNQTRKSRMVRRRVIASGNTRSKRVCKDVARSAFCPFQRGIEEERHRLLKEAAERRGKLKGLEARYRNILQVPLAHRAQRRQMALRRETHAAETKRAIALEFFVFSDDSARAGRRAFPSLLRHSSRTSKRPQQQGLSQRPLWGFRDKPFRLSLCLSRTRRSVKSFSEKAQLCTGDCRAPPLKFQVWKAL